MDTFLLIVAAVVVGLLVIFGIAWYWFRTRLGAAPRDERPSSETDSIPPFRISLMPRPETPWQLADDVEMLSDVIEQSGFRRVSDFAIPEMKDLSVRGFCDRTRAAYAIIYEHPQVGLVVDAVRIHKQATATVTSAPNDGLDHPDTSLRAEVPLPASPLERGETINAWQQILTDLDQLSAERPSIPALAKTFVAAFTSSYAAEMDWRIRRGGVSADEIRRVASTGAQDEPDADTISAVQGIWRKAIDTFIESEVIASYLRSEPMPAAEWERQRERVFVVHEQSDHDALSDALCASVALHDADADVLKQRRDAMRAKIDAAFSDGETLDGFQAAQSALPSTQRFAPLAHVQRPWRAAIYLRPPPNQLAA
ncbi:MAG: hypothetical protein AAF493_05000 [Pseudomonadota bacterium]